MAKIIQTSLRRAHMILADRFYLTTKPKGHNAVFYGVDQRRKIELIQANLLQACDSFFVFDPKGVIFASLSGFLTEKGYRVHGVDLAALGDSEGIYNPYHYAPLPAAQNRVGRILEAAGIDYARQVDMPEDKLTLDQMSRIPTAIFCITDPDKPGTELLASLLFYQTMRETIRHIVTDRHTLYLLCDCAWMSEEVLTYLANHADFLCRRKASCILMASSPYALKALFGEARAEALLGSCFAQVYLGDKHARLAKILEEEKLLSRSLAELDAGQCMIFTEEGQTDALCYDICYHPEYRRWNPAGKERVRKNE